MFMAHGPYLFFYHGSKGLVLPLRRTRSGDIDPVIDLGSRVEEVLSDGGGF